jgi:hypothetical protein
MLRTLRAFAWMRWRILMNSLERTEARDALERFSLAVEQIGPIVAALVMVPSALALAGLAVRAGWQMGSGGDGLAVQVIRFVLVATTALAALGPILFSSADRTNAVRLLLLPIARRTLYVAQAGGTLVDPWLLPALPIAIALPAGLAAAGASLRAALAAIAGVVFVIVLAGIAGVASSLMHLLVRDRRRGELLALAIVVILPMLGLLPMLLTGGARGRPERAADRPVWEETTRAYAARALPSEMYLHAVGTRADGAPVVPFLSLAASAALLHGCGVWLFGRVLDARGGSSVRGRALAGPGPSRIPGLKPAASAVAMGQVRLVLRTTRGRAVIVSPIVVFAMFALLLSRGGEGLDFGLVTLQGGIGLATFGAMIVLTALVPIAMNQFAVDGAGLTLALLSPLEDRDLLLGKAVGNALVMIPSAAVCIAGPAVVFRGGSLALWLCVPLGLLAVYLLFAPVAAAVSAVFPRAVDLNSVGRGGNAHAAGGLIGLVTIVAGGVPAVFLVLLATRVLERPALAPVLIAAWCAVCAIVAAALFVPVRALFSRRRENLGLTV